MRRSLPIAALALLCSTELGRGQSCETPLIVSGTPVSVSLEATSDGDWLVMSGNNDIVVFKREITGWVQHQSLPLPGFGYSNNFHLAIDGTTLAVGVIGGGGGLGGNVRIFELQGSTWTLAANLNDPQAYNHFGWDVALDGDWLAVGVPGAERAEVYRREAGTWGHHQTIGFPGGPWGFGLPLAMRDGWLAINGASTTIAAVGMYELIGSTWVTAGAVEGTADGFGHALAFGSGELIVGAPWESTNEGAAFVFAESGGIWSQTQVLTASMPGHDQFGQSLAVFGDDLAVGAPGDNHQQLFDVGAVELMQRGTSGYEFVARVRQDLPFEYGAFGRAITLTGDDLFVNGVLQQGVSYMYHYDLDCLSQGQVTAFCDCASDGPCGNDEAGAGCANSTGQGALLSVASGTASSGDDDLVLEVSGLPAAAFGVVFLGNRSETATPFGAGALCVSAPFCRLSVRQADAAGVLTEGPGIVASPLCQIHAMETYGIQCWYRDPTGPCGQFFNLSSGLIVTFGL